MALVAADLAQALADALDEDTVSDQLEGWARAVVTEITSGTATFGNVPSPHAILALVGPRLAVLIAKEAGYPGTTPELIAYANAITTHIMTSAIVTYKTPVPSPPSLLPPASWFLDGTVSGMSGPVLAQLIATALKQPRATERLEKKSAAIVDYIQTNAGVMSGAIS